MIDNISYDIIRQTINLIIISCLPLVGATAIAGIVVGIVQSATSINDSASAYVVRLLTICAVVYLMTSTISTSLSALFEFVFTAIGNFR
ncbi:MAG: flagellar biosynthetic protein FliQ [SAR324 cluster bacterium]|uniref:Flagellar biosynthetic protein FliQ n=1 Tax=SAR324 cluster bacterium TaxID=2024889 RepID=A0A7X9IJ26_9DELT|nr:flagellar biosynthetic protein FliQ [SAR324 cluster bacterium]